MSPSPQAAYAAKLRADHQVRAIRPSLLRAPDSPHSIHDTVAVGLLAHGADVVALATARPRRDGIERVGVIVPLDSNGRVFATKPLAALGWSPDTALVAEVRGHLAIVRPGVLTRDAAWLLPTRVDSKARLRLPTGVKGALQVRAGDQVVVCAVPDTGELHLIAADDLLQAFTGEIHPQPVEDSSDTASTPELRPSTRIRAAVKFSG